MFLFFSTSRYSYDLTKSSRNNTLKLISKTTLLIWNQWLIIDAASFLVDRFSFQILFSTHYSICFTTTCLSVGEYCSIVALKHILNERKSRLFVYLFLGWMFWKYLGECKRSEYIFTRCKIWLFGLSFGESNNIAMMIDTGHIFEFYVSLKVTVFGSGFGSNHNFDSLSHLE